MKRRSHDAPIRTESVLSVRLRNNRAKYSDTIGFQLRKMLCLNWERYCKAHKSSSRALFPTLLGITLTPELSRAPIGMERRYAGPSRAQIREAHPFSSLFTPALQPCRCWASIDRGEQLINQPLTCDFSMLGCLVPGTVRIEMTRRVYIRFYQIIVRAKAFLPFGEFHVLRTYFTSAASVMDQRHKTSFRLGMI